MVPSRERSLRRGTSACTQFMTTYGTDFSLMLAELPGKTRRQIRKKFNRGEATRKRQILARRQLEERRKKSIFEEDVLELALEGPPFNNPKPNNPYH